MVSISPVLIVWLWLEHSDSLKITSIRFTPAHGRNSGVGREGGGLAGERVWRAPSQNMGAPLMSDDARSCHDRD